MSSCNNFLGTGPPQFAEENYHIWAIKMKSYLKALNLWEAIEDGPNPTPLGPDPTLSQIKVHEDQKARKPRALTCFHSSLSEAIFIRIMTCESPKEVWEKLKDEFEGSEKVKSIKLLTLKREFELLRMKDRENVEDCSSKLLDLVNKIRLLGEEIIDKRIVEKIMMNLPAKFEAKESCDHKTLTVVELISKLQVHEQRSLMREDKVTEGALQAMHKGNQVKKDGKKVGGVKSDKGKIVAALKNSENKGKFPPCNSCHKTNHLERDCWFKGKPPIQCKYCKKLGHVEKSCRLKPKQDQEKKAQQANYAEEED